MRTPAAPVVDAPEAPDLQPTRLYLAEMVLVASVNPGDERMTDILNRGGDLPVLPAGASWWEAEDWLAIPVDQLMLVLPPRHVSPPDKRAERQRYPARMRIGEWEVAGTAHLKPGAEQDAILRITQPFLPLTDVTISTGGGAVAERHEVAIVNLRHAEFIVD